MSIDFSPQRWQKIKKDAADWWSGRLSRPLIQVTFRDEPDGKSGKGIPWSEKNKTLYDLSIPPREIVDRWDNDLSRTHWLGDAFPHIFVDFGPGVAAAFMGARPEPRQESVWFHPPRRMPLSELKLQYQADNVYLRRVADIYRAGVEKWRGEVLMSMTDLGGNLDILSAFRPAEELLLDLCDSPADVKRVTWDAHNLWWRYFEEFNRIFQDVTPGYSSWTPMYSETPYYMLQCDFCYMIGPAMFEEFVRPELAESSRKLGNAFYHLDGVGQLAHLDKLLSIPDLKGIQWIPGAGKPPAEQWPDVIRRVLDAGKKFQFFGNCGSMEVIEKTVGRLDGIMLVSRDVPAKDVPKYEACLRHYGA